MMGTYVPQLYHTYPTTQVRWMRLVFGLSVITKLDVPQQGLGTMPSMLSPPPPGLAVH